MKGDEQLSRSIYLWFIWSMYWCTCLITLSRNIKNISENRCLKECRIAEKWSTNDWRPPRFHIFHVGEWTSPIDAHPMSNASKRIHSTPILTVWWIVKHIKPPGPEFNINLNINIIQADHWLHAKLFKPSRAMFAKSTAESRDRQAQPGKVVTWSSAVDAAVRFSTPKRPRDPLLAGRAHLHCPSVVPGSVLHPAFRGVSCQIWRRTSGTWSLKLVFPDASGWSHLRL